MTTTSRLIVAGAAGADLTRAQLRHLVSSAQVVPVRQGVYLDATEAARMDRAARHRAQVGAAVAAQGAPGVVSHVSAAVLGGLPEWNASMDRVHLSKDRRNAGRRDVRVPIHTAPLAADEVVVVDGIRVTSVSRTLLDVGCAESFESVVVMVDHALHHGLVTREALDEQLRRGKGRHGRERAARAFAFADGRSESVGESRSRVGMQLAGLRSPGLQREIRRPDGSLVARVDFDWG